MLPDNAALSDVALAGFLLRPSAKGGEGFTERAFRKLGAARFHANQMSRDVPIRPLPGGSQPRKKEAAVEG